MENNRKPPMPGPYYPPFSAGLVGPVSDDVYAAMLDARAQAEAAETAKGKAEDAQEAAETAQGKAEDAQEAAEEAQGKAEDAQEAAETAQGKAEDAQAAAEAAAETLVPDPTLTEEDQPAEAKATGEAIDDAKASSLALRTGTAATIPNGTDYDTLTTPGNYRVTSSESVATMVNCPISTSHRMIVMTAGNTETVLQILIAATGKIYLRRQLSGTWNEWARDLTTLDLDNTLTQASYPADAKAVGDAIDTVTADFLALRTGYASTIPNNTDYDTLTTPGNYRVQTAENVATMSHCPISVAHRMIVMTLQLSGAVFQMIISGVGKVYTRAYYNNAWSDWVRDLTTKDIDDTLTQANYPADAKAVGDAIDTVTADFLALRTGYASVIPDNTDYDTLTTPGNYRVISPESVATMVNCPISTLHRMVVMTAGTTATVFQILIAATGKIYLRRQLNGSWNEWARDLTTLDLDTTLTQAGYPADAKTVGDAISAIGTEIGPMSYVKTEADRVADKVRSVQTTKSFTFVAVSDMHYKSDDTDAGNGTAIRAALRDMKDGVKCIASQIHIDFYACFGDIIWRLRSDGDYDKGYAEAVGATKILNECFGNNPQIRMIGNHDPNCEGSTGYFSENLMNSFTGLYNSFLINDSSFPTGAFGYYDFEERKVRLIVLNTSLYTDNSPPAQGETQYMLGNQQMYWMAQHLDLSGKTDAQDWQIVIMSHVRLDGNEAVSYYNATQVFKAYVNGSTWTRSSYSYNFAGKNDAKLAVYFCGHSHMYEVSNLQTDYNGTTRVFDSTLPLARMFIPNALPDRDMASMDGVTYEKTANSAASTSFLVITIDFDAKVVYGHHYGAGIDIILHYDSSTASSGSPLTLSTGLSSPAWGTMDADTAAVNSGAVTPVAAGDVVIFAKSSADNTIEAWNVHSEV